MNVYDCMLLEMEGDTAASEDEMQGPEYSAYFPVQCENGTFTLKSNFELLEKIVTLGDKASDEQLERIMSAWMKGKSKIMLLSAVLTLPNLEPGRFVTRLTHECRLQTKHFLLILRKRLACDFCKENREVGLVNLNKLEINA